MAKGGYLGGSTHISPLKNPDWFGDSDIETPDEKERRLAHERALAKLAEIESAKPESGTNRNYRRKLAAAREAVRLTKPRPRTAPVQTTITHDDEKQIAELKRNLAAWGKKAQSAAQMHEALRQELIKLLTKNNIAPMNYPETRKLTL